jgi:GntR family transcriptional repressor for pyruvate dehydrogenase complex
LSIDSSVSEAVRIRTRRDQDGLRDGEYSPAPVKRGSIISQAAEEICRLINGKGLKPGDALPPETQLSAMLAISRNSVREAIRMLHGLGVVEKSAGHGAVVSAASTAGWGVVDEATLIEAAEVANEVRILTMEKCVALAAERLTDEELDHLARTFAELERSIAREDRAAAKQAHDSFYGLILAGARNSLLVSMFRQADSARLTTLYRPADKTFIADQHLKHHRTLLRALIRRDAAAAARAARKHYLALGQMIKLVTRHPSVSPTIGNDRNRPPARKSPTQ